jgi:hypothetical protein
MKELTMAELSAGVRALVGRMESNPNEFYGEADKWRFMFSSNFREVLTEPEKGALHEALKEVRRKEFDEKVMRELLKDQMENQLKGVGFTERSFGQAQIHAEGTAIAYASDTSDSFKYASGTTALRNPIISLAVGKQTLSEEDIAQMKAATTSPSLFK